MAQFGSDTILAKDNVLIPLPMVSLNFGIANLMSDVKLSNGPSPIKQFGYQLTVTQRVTKFLNASFELYGGMVYGEEQRDLTNLNFKTSLFSQRLNIEYNFYPLLKPNDNGIQLIRPYIGFGLGMLSFRSKGDLRSSNGSTYNYWNDGLIYAEVEGTVNVSEATVVERDFVYESDLRDANLDGLRKYSQLAFTLPINAGIRFQITKNIGLNAAFAYALNFSDMLDNVSVSGTGDRLGSSGNDNHLFGSLGLTVYLGTTKPSAKPRKATSEELAAIAKAKADAKRADQKAAKEQAAEAAKLAAGKLNEPNATTSVEDANVTENQSNETTIADLGSTGTDETVESNKPEVKTSGPGATAVDKGATPTADAATQTGVVGENSVTNQGEEVATEASAATKGDPAVLNPESSATSASDKNIELNSSDQGTKGLIAGNAGVDFTSQAKKAQTESSTQVTVESSKLETSDGQNSELSKNKKTDANSTETETAQRKVSIEPPTAASESEKKPEKNLSDNSKGKNINTSTSIEMLENSSPKKTGNFHWADLDSDGMISPIEVLHFIDLLFEGDGERTVEDIQLLIDYYFDQE
jgi:hypothetical protein